MNYDLQFFGGVAGVTGSCYLLTAGGKRVLIDCGLVQGSRDQELKNRADFDFEPQDLDAVLLTHAHLDHSGRLPILVKKGFTGAVYAHPATIELCKLMLADAGYLNEKEVQWQNKARSRKGLDPIEPLYTRGEAIATMESFEPVEYAQQLNLSPDIEVTFYDAGHILGSSSIHVSIAYEGARKQIVFSGDLGNPGAPILKDPQPPREADLIIMESTYGDRLHRSWDETWAEMGEILSKANSKRGNILIPAFTIGRTQLLLYTFREHFTEWNLDAWNIVLDTPMGISATDIYSSHPELFDSDARQVYSSNGNPFDLPNFYATKSTEESMKLNEINSGTIIIAGSGMCTGGRIKHHLKHNISRPGAHVMIVGFQARGTTGRALVDGAQRIRLYGEEYPVAASVHTIGGLSAHADQQDLINWCQSIKGASQCLLVHGEPEASAHLKTRLEQCSSLKVHCPVPGERIDLRRL
ncbi:MAG: MBL fold metallo-hydrolase [Gammaproteobacteria bacterium]|nr:MBL fold metallo-hydrolase [Gammaproteobacteria bacterium]